ncbi:amidohydrolase [Lachnospiraceae bacterium 45-P1]
MLLIKNGNLITMAGLYEQTGDILIDDGKIVKVGQVGEVPENCEMIDAAGRTVTPGLVEAHCHMGLWGTACQEEMDGNESTSPALPGLRGLDAVNPEDATFDAALRHGITTVVTGPGSGNIIGGTFMAIKTAGEDVDSRIVRQELAMKMALGENPKTNFGKRGMAPKTRMMNAAIMREQLFKAKEYYENYKVNGQKPDFPFDFHMHSLMRVFEGMRVKIHAHQADDIQTAIRIANEFGLRYSIEHCTEGYMIPEVLKKNNAQCLLGPTVGGKSKVEIQNRSFDAGRILEEAGITFALITDAPFVPIENQLLQVALYVKNGMSREMAIRSVTLNAAKITDIDARVGSIEPGKDADVVIWDVEPLATMSQAGTVIIDGRIAYQRKAGESNVDYPKL